MAGGPGAMSGELGAMTGKRRAIGAEFGAIAGDLGGVGGECVQVAVDLGAVAGALSHDRRGSSAQSAESPAQSPVHANRVSGKSSAVAGA